MTSATMHLAERQKKKAIAGNWTAHNDARGYVVTGDPAVRLTFLRAAEALTPHD